MTTPKDRKLAIADAVEYLGAFRDPSEPDRWVYLAEETESYWSVTEEALLELASMFDAHGRDIETYNKWSEADDTAIDCGRKRPK